MLSYGLINYWKWYNQRWRMIPIIVISLYVFPGYHHTLIIFLLLALILLGIDYWITEQINYKVYVCEYIVPTVYPCSLCAVRSYYVSSKISYTVEWWLRIIYIHTYIHTLTHTHTSSSDFFAAFLCCLGLFLAVKEKMATETTRLSRFYLGLVSFLVIPIIQSSHSQLIT